VRNRAKLAYHSVGDWLEGKGPAPARVNQIPGLADNLRLQDDAAQRLAARRRQRGSLSLETNETKAVFAGDTLSHLEPERVNRATQLIEEFMIAANGVTAVFLSAKKLPSFRRVLRSPERWARIVQLAAGFDEHLPGTPDGLALENFLLRRHQAAPEKFADLSLAVVKLIGRGEYALNLPGGNPPGHFGLAVRDYTHSTAPNRRFPDLLTQRLLKAALAGTPQPYSIPELTDIAQHCTERESDATKVERRVQKSAAALLLANQVGRRFQAIVTGAAPKGTWVRILQPPIEGKLDRGFAGLHVGDRLQVKLVHTDYERGFIDFERD
jgi:exoribonuclease-2